MWMKYSINKLLIYELYLYRWIKSTTQQCNSKITNTAIFSSRNEQTKYIKNSDFYNIDKKKVIILISEIFPMYGRKAGID